MIAHGIYWPSQQYHASVLRWRIALAARAEFERRRLAGQLAKYQRRVA